MAKEKSDKKDKKERKEKEKRSEKDGVSKTKKEKRSKKVAENGEVTAALLETLDKHVQGVEVVKKGDDLPAQIAPPLRAMVPFANPLAEEKACKKLLKTVKKAAKNKSLKRGVKEVVKSLRKSPPVGTAPGVVILAADISPMDVISHIPVLCEDHNVPYIFVPSRAELGAAGNTKRPTSVVMISVERGGKRKSGTEPEEGEEEFKEVYRDLKTFEYFTSYVIADMILHRVAYKGTITRHMTNMLSNPHKRNKKFALALSIINRANNYGTNLQLYKDVHKLESRKAKLHGGKAQQTKKLP
ncbi:hypothetical protein FGG08_005537 [Glutinoglossum americanum]|uniref:Ribosomal protein eL8/eL30/eS12/Gadd45 domain-containing protein n=1 Tax=Glutinoglossum americanum TaxID=1670608 RepID=A0A9P8I2R5_9PEZI|nr:hypothetical protein FGG08_005537 [Glutinoglossum americanum]